MHHVLQYEDIYYVCGSSRQALVADKTADDRYYLLTLAAIAEEIKARDLPKKTSIILAAGLPLTRYGRERDAFSNYLKRTNKSVRFLYEGEEYQVTISQVMLFPQGFAAVAGMRILNEEPVFALLDIGGWTLDACSLTLGRTRKPATAITSV